ncbi:MAG TPA: ABC transporter permease [Acidimicrobiia bacterium]|nr:ABC transporter permease [Acidimicrobiia bacterium]
MKVWTIGMTGLRRLFRDRSSIFFVFILPLAIILLIGAQFGSGGAPEILVHHDGSQVATSIVEALEGVRAETSDDADQLVEDVERGGASAGVVFPDDLDRILLEGGEAEIGLVSRADTPASVRQIVSAAVSAATADLRVARIVAEVTGRPTSELIPVVAGTDAPGIEVEVTTVGESLFGPNITQFSVGAAQQLVLFVFLTTLSGSAALIQSRQLGVTTRMLSTPTPVRTIVMGEGLARFLVGGFQGFYIVIFTLVAFGVDWGSPLGWIALLVAFAATGAAFAMLMGAIFRNDQQAGGLSVLFGLGLAALGGAMLPIELFSSTMRRVAHLTPHAWAIDGFGDLVYRGGNLSDVAGEVGVLLAYATVVAVLAAWLLRRAILRP